MIKTDETTELTLKFDSNGLMAAIAQDYQTKDILMLAWMNQEAFDKTVTTGEAHYWSRSRQELWHKGATSGATQTVHGIKLDCDQDAVILFIDQKGGGACHTGRKSCFYRSVKNDTLIFDEEKK
jgi:phosphoribosyl-AMP cyclohydrolase